MHIKDRTKSRLSTNSAAQVGYVINEAPGRMPFSKEADLIHREVFYRVHDAIWIDLHVEFIYRKLLNDLLSR